MDTSVTAKQPRSVASLGRYDIVGLLATGGMGELYLARMRGLEGFERLTVLKRLKPDFAGRSEHPTALLDEVRVLANVQHPNVVQVYDAGASKDGSYFYSMEFLVGQDLRQLLRRARRDGHPLPLPQAVYIARSVLGGLGHVHERTDSRGNHLRIVHRDVSPSNVFVTYEGVVKLIDFGIAQVGRPQEDPTGLVRGKAWYVSPEQCRGEPVDARSDLFSLGIVLWEMTTGRGLYHSSDSRLSLQAICELEAPRPSTVIAGYPAQLEAIVMKALSRRVSDRWRSAKEMLAALETFALDEGWRQTDLALAELMEVRFAEEIAAMRRAQAEGQDLADIVMGQVGKRPPSATPGSRSTPSVEGPGRTNQLKQALRLVRSSPAPRHQTRRPRLLASLAVLAGLVTLGSAVLAAASRDVGTALAGRAGVAEPFVTRAARASALAPLAEGESADPVAARDAVSAPAARASAVTPQAEGGAADPLAARDAVSAPAGRAVTPQAEGGAADPLAARDAVSVPAGRASAEGGPADPVAARDAVTAPAARARAVAPLAEGGAADPFAARDAVIRPAGRASAVESIAAGLPPRHEEVAPPSDSAPGLEVSPTRTVAAPPSGEAPEMDVSVAVGCIHLTRDSALPTRARKVEGLKASVSVAPNHATRAAESELPSRVGKVEGLKALVSVAPNHATREAESELPTRARKVEGLKASVSVAPNHATREAESELPTRARKVAGLNAPVAVAPNQSTEAESELPTPARKAEGLRAPVVVAPNQSTRESVLPSPAKQAEGRPAWDQDSLEPPQ